MDAEVAHVVGETIAPLASQFDFLLVPGFKDSGPEHWQSYWQRNAPFFKRIAQRRWDQPDIEGWVDAAVRVLDGCKRPTVLIGHSLGALASVCVASDGHPRLAGLMLVAPAEPGRFEAEERVPEHSLPVPSLVVASDNDPLISSSRSERLAKLWNAQFVSVGEAGHINAEAGFGPWPHGLRLLASLAGRI